MQATLEALQRECLVDQVAALTASLAGRGPNAGPLLAITEAREALAGLLDARLGDLTKALGDLSAQIANLGVKVNAWGGALQDDRDGLGAHIDHRLPSQHRTSLATPLRGVTHPRRSAPRQGSGAPNHG